MINSHLLPASHISGTDNVNSLNIISKPTHIKDAINVQKKRLIHFSPVSQRKQILHIIYFKPIHFFQKHRRLLR